MASTLIIQALIALVSLIIYQKLFRKSKNLPPGPKGVPLIGNIFDAPSKDTTDVDHWRSMTDKYGPITSINVFGQTTIFIADKEAAQEILEKKCSKSSSRPAFHFSIYSGFGGIVSMHQYDRRFKFHRKLMHKGFGTKRLVSRHAGIQEQKAGWLLMQTLKAPEQILQHMENEANSVMLNILYGYTASSDDPLVKLNDRVNHNFFRAADPFGWLMEFIPAIKWLPDGFPGTGFKALAKDNHRNATAYGDVPYNFVRKQMMNHGNASSFTARLVQEFIGDAEEPNEDVEDAIKWAAAGLQVGGAETTVTTITAFILAAIMFPEVQRKAQEEIDRITGGTRLPTLADREQMPYVNAMVTEALRWFPILPVGFPHLMNEDMTYKGYDFPKGSYVLWATWEFSHDPSVYSDPHKFDPERFLAPRNEPTPWWTVFGFGRRVCPGRHIAEAALFINMASLVGFFDFNKAVDEQGNVIEPKLEINLERSAVVRPMPFPFKVTPRSEKHVGLIKVLEKNYPSEESDASQLDEIPLS